MSEKAVLHTIKHGSSGRGQSYYKAAHECGFRRAYYNGITQNYNDSTYEQRVGIIMHNILEMYYDPTNARQEIVVADDLFQDPAVVEAWRLFAEYRSRFANREWGTVIGVEYLITPTPLILSRLGNVSGRLDMVVEMTAEDVEAISMFRPDLLGIEPGVYIVDHKTSGMRKQPAQWRNELQGILYMRLWELMNPDKPCKGTIYNAIVTHKELTDKSFYCVVQTMPRVPMDELDATIQAFITSGERLVQIGQKNILSCVSSYGRECALLGTVCDPYDKSQKLT